MQRRADGDRGALPVHAQYVFDDLGYRRWEWKCNNRNEPSKRAAERFGFKFEGVFRQHMVIKGENRDTAWYSIIDKEWPALRQAYEAWLDPANFDSEGTREGAWKTFEDLSARKVIAPERSMVADFRGHGGTQPRP